MSGAAAGIAVAVSWLWLGMVLAISFLEAPVKFRAPGVTLQIGLGIGRLVFRVLNVIEVVWAGAVVSSVIFGGAAALPQVGGIGAAAVLAIQLAAVRPALTRRSNRVLAGAEGLRSQVHLVYVALETIKVAALLVTGTSLLS